MTVDLRWFWTRLTANYWFYPALFALFGAGLAFVCVMLDRGGFAERINEIEWLIPARADGASDMLTVIASSMIAIAATVFSITIVAVSFASGTYGPRLLTNFMEDKGNQLSLATFIGTFVYALTVLRSVRTPGESGAEETALAGFVPQLSLLVAYGLTAISVAVLVFFLNHIPSSIRINLVLQGIGQRLIAGIGQTYPEEGDLDGPSERPVGGQLTAVKTGYVQLIDFEKLEEIAREQECIIVLPIRTGDFVHPGLSLAEVCGRPVDEDLTRRVRRCFTTGFARTPAQDPQFLIDELVEIGLRALSPGINDPFTAVNALHWLGAATAELGNRRLVKQVCKSEAEDCPVLPLPDDFAHYVGRGFGAMRSGAATSPIAARVMLDTLGKASGTIAAPARRQVLFAEGKRLRDQARAALTGPDLVEVEARYHSFAGAMN